MTAFRSELRRIPESARTASRRAALSEQAGTKSVAQRTTERPSAPHEDGFMIRGSWVSAAGTSAGLRGAVMPDAGSVTVSEEKKDTSAGLSESECYLSLRSAFSTPQIWIRSEL